MEASCHDKLQAPQDLKEQNSPTRQISNEIGKIIAEEDTFQVLDPQGSICLQPHPSESPYDPLNWSPMRKYVVTAVLVLWGGLALTAQNFISMIIPLVQETFPNEPFERVNLLFTITAPMLAPADVIFFIMALTLGRKPTTLISLIIFVISNIIGLLGYNIFNHTLASRILAGIGTAPLDALMISMITSYTFVHQRGLFTQILASGSGVITTVLPVGLSYLATDYGLQWVYVLLTAAVVVLSIAVWLVIPEINFDRDSCDSIIPITAVEHRSWRNSTLARSPIHGALWNPVAGWKQMYRQSPRRALQWLLLAAVDPAIWWLGCMQIVFYGGFSAVLTYYATLLTSPPWNWPQQNVALAQFAVIPGWGFLVVIGWLSDRSIIWIAKLRSGQSKIEDRLFMTPVAAMMAIACFMGFGVLVEDFIHQKAPHWFACVFLVALAWIAFALSTMLQSVYLGGSMNQDENLAGLTMISVIRDLGSFGLSYGVVPLTVKVGYVSGFGLFAGLVGLVSLGAIPLYIYGPRMRHFLATSTALLKMGVKSE